MEKENLNNTLGIESKSEKSQRLLKTGRKLISTQKHLSSFSVFMRILIIIIWTSMILSFIHQGYLAYQIAISGLFYGLFAAILWFSIGNIRSTQEIVWEEFLSQEEENETQTTLESHNPPESNN